MKIHEITAGQLNELDVLGGVASLAKDAVKATWGAMSNPVKDQFRSTKDYFKSYTNNANPDDSSAAFIAKLTEEMPKDGERAYYKDTSYTYNEKSKSWYETESQDKAGLVAQRALMLQYGFTISGKPTIALRKKILKQLRREAQGVSADKKFTAAATAKIVNAFQQSMNEYRSTGDLIRYLNNAEFLAQYIAQGYDLTLLKKDVEGFFMSGGVPYTNLLGDLYQNLFVKPDASKVADLKATYKTSGTRPASTKTLGPADDTAIKNAIVSSISTFDASDASNFGNYFNSIKSAGYSIDDYTNLVQSEATKLVRRSQTYTDLGDMTAFLDVMTALKPVLPPVPATFGRKINSLNFKTMFPGISARDLALLRQKRTALMTP